MIERCGFEDSNEVIRTCSDDLICVDSNAEHS